MEELTLNEDLQRSVNNAFSINYMVLDNFRHVDPANHNGVLLHNDIFGEKSRKQKTYESLYHDYAEIRNEAFALLNNFFKSYGYEKCFIENTNTLVNLYNKVYNADVKVGDYFTDKEIIDISFLEKFADDIENNETLSMFERTNCYLALNDFLVFYEQYKMWLSSFEIFQTLQEDITSHGSKSLMYGKPTNKNVFVIEKEGYKKFITPILVYMMEEEKKLEKQRKTLIKQIKAGHTELQEDLSVILTVLVAIKLIYLTDSNINNRFEFANKMPEPKHKIDAILNKFVSKVLFNETEFKVDKAYIHKYEILDFVNALSVFPYFDDITKKLTDIALGSERDLTKFTNQKESTLS